MKTTSIKTLLGLTTAMAMTTGGAMAQDIQIGHLTHHTGEYGGFGEFFDAITEMTLDVINDDPPLGRTMTPIHQDVGTIGEARAARKLVDSDGVDILLNASHSYMSYRDFILDKVASGDAPLLPSVHGGGIESELGGTAVEPLFRGSPMDSAQGSAALLHAQAAGHVNVVLVATEASGSQLQKNAAIRAAEILGMNVIEAIDIQPNQPNYRSVVSRIGSLEPDAVIVFSAPADGGAFVKNAAESGNSWFIVGTSEWQEPGFIQTATTDAVAKHESVTLAAFSNAEGPAWEFYQPQAEASEHSAAIGDVSNSYAIQYFDLLVVTALAIEKSGGTDAAAWTESMYDVSGGDGEIVYTYADGIAALRAGKEINYDGVTGSMEYTDTGVVSGIFGIFEWDAAGEALARVSLVDGDDVLALDQ